jgi:hypothetical protein
LIPRACASFIRFSRAGLGGRRPIHKFFWTKVFEHRWHAANVVGVPMGNGHRVEARDAARPEIGSDDVFAEVELRTSVPDGAAGVDEQSAALRHYQQDSVTLADVDRGHFERPGARFGFRWDEGEREGR